MAQEEPMSTRSLFTPLLAVVAVAVAVPGESQAAEPAEPPARRASEWSFRRAPDRSCAGITYDCACARARWTDGLRARLNGRPVGGDFGRPRHGVRTLARVAQPRPAPRAQRAPRDGAPARPGCPEGERPVRSADEPSSDRGRPGPIRRRRRQGPGPWCRAHRSARRRRDEPRVDRRPRSAAKRRGPPAARSRGDP